MKMIILVSGPHGTGKTTAVMKALAPYRFDERVEAIYADVGMWRKAPEVMSAMMAPKVASVVPVIVVEGTHRIALTVIRSLEGILESERAIHAFHVTTDPSEMREMIRARCVSKGKTFREEYWTKKRCEKDVNYYPMLFARLPVQTRVYRMDETYSAQGGLVEDILESVRSCVGAPIESDAPFKLS